MSASLTAILTAAAMVSFFTALAADPKPAPPAIQGSAKSGKAEPKFKNVGVDEFDKLRHNKTNTVIDVRTREEYEQGHLPGAVLIDIGSDDFAQRIGKLDKDKTYLVHCAMGGRSTRACKKMEQAGFKNLYNLEGGLAAWKKAGKPVEK